MKKKSVLPMVFGVVIAIVGYFAVSHFLKQFRDQSFVGQPKMVGGSCENQMQEIAKTTLKTLNQIFNFDESQQQTFVSVYVQEMCGCLSPELKGQDIVQFMTQKDNQELLSKCSKQAGEKAGASAASSSNESPSESE